MFKCKICKKEENETTFTDGKDLLLAQECFHCHYWMERVKNAERNYQAQVVVEGVVYQVGKEDAVGFRGFDGQTFIIKFNDGRMCWTTNLLYNGKIPKKFKDRIPDNAVFMTDKWT